MRCESGYSIHSADTPRDERVLVLKEGDSFTVVNGSGDAEPGGTSQYGLYIGGTRHLSTLRVRLLGHPATPLGSAVTRDGTRVAVDLTNPELARNGSVGVRRGALHLGRVQHLCGGVLTERLAVTNHERTRLDVSLEVEFASDFADVFEVRGMRRARRGECHPARVEPAGVTLSYAGLDGVTRATVVRFEPAPTRLEGERAVFALALNPGERVEVHCSYAPAAQGAGPAELHTRLRRALRERIDGDRPRYCMVESSHETLSRWISQSRADIRALLTDVGGEPYPFAGIPWYSCPFGRDGIITALQTLWLNPDIARGVLLFLAGTQSDRPDPARDAEPGKILHEMREGEMAALGEVPFGRYYGTVDATPLFLILAGEYYRATGHLELIDRLRPNLLRALEWIDRYGDADGDGFVEHRCDNEGGLVNQGWRDSHDAVFHADGSTPRGPLALCEVQAYVYDAKRQAARLLRALGDERAAARLRAEAAALRERFEAAFWRPSMGGGRGTYALALDGAKRPCDVVGSTAGHCLFSGIASPERAAAVAQTLLSPAMLSGWGVRTIGEQEARYNPMSYHNGSVWPHDNAMIGAGLKRYGYRSAASALLLSWLDASSYLEMHRLPELVCGFERVPDRGPVLYPVACNPQAWASGAVFMLLGACLGLRVEGAEGRVRVHRPHLPREIEEVRLRGLRVGASRLDLAFRREKAGVDVLLLKRDGPARVVVTR